jgi:hypothetical protein
MVTCATCNDETGPPERDVEFIVILTAAARFRRAWLAVEDGPGPLTELDPRVIEVHDATRALMEATETVDLVATFDALGELVRQVDGGRPTMP